MFLVSYFLDTIKGLTLHKYFTHGNTRTKQDGLPSELRFETAGQTTGKSQRTCKHKVTWSSISEFLIVGNCRTFDFRALYKKKPVKINEQNDGSMCRLRSVKAKYRFKLRTISSPENANQRGSMKQVNCLCRESKFTLMEQLSYLNLVGRKISIGRKRGRFCIAYIWSLKWVWQERS